MLRGVTNITLDAKGRMSFPRRYQDKLNDACAGQVVVTVDQDHCLLIYPMPEWELIERKLVKLPSFNKQARRLQRLLIGHATECELDSAGRILLPAPLRQFAGLDKKAVMIGQGNKFELWDEEVWNQRTNEWLETSDDEADMPIDLENFSL